MAARKRPVPEQATLLGRALDQGGVRLPRARHALGENGACCKSEFVGPGCGFRLPGCIHVLAASELPGQFRRYGLGKRRSSGSEGHSATDQRAG